MTTKFDIDKFSRENNFGMWKLKMGDKACRKGTKVVRSSKASTVTHKSDAEENTNNNFKLGNTLVQHWKWRKTHQESPKSMKKQHKKIIKKTYYKKWEQRQQRKFVE